VEGRTRSSQKARFTERVERVALWLASPCSELRAGGCVPVGTKTASRALKCPVAGCAESHIKKKKGVRVRRTRRFVQTTRTVGTTTSAPVRICATSLRVWPFFLTVSVLYSRFGDERNLTQRKRTHYNNGYLI
jgi:hypothetical protein